MAGRRAAGAKHVTALANPALVDQVRHQVLPPSAPETTATGCASVL
jgi:hypothetical protein